VLRYFQSFPPLVLARSGSMGQLALLSPMGTPTYVHCLTWRGGKIKSTTEMIIKIFRDSPWHLNEGTGFPLERIKI
jgi:hypothetical protein